MALCILVLKVTNKNSGPSVRGGVLRSQCVAGFVASDSPAINSKLDQDTLSIIEMFENGDS